MSNFVYDGHLCFHELLHRKLEVAEYGHALHTVSYLKTILPTVSAVDVHIGFFNMGGLRGLVESIVREYPNILTVNVIKTPDQHFDPRYASHASINKFNDNVRSLKSIESLKINVDIQLIDIKSVSMPFDSFCRIITKIGTFYWTEEHFEDFSWDLSEGEYYDRINKVADSDRLYRNWWEGLVQHFPEFGWQTYKSIFQDNIKPFDMQHHYPPKSLTKV